MWFLAVLSGCLLVAALLFPWRLYLHFEGTLSLFCLELRFLRFKKKIKKSISLFKKKKTEDFVEEEVFEEHYSSSKNQSSFQEEKTFEREPSKEFTPKDNTKEGEELAPLNQDYDFSDLEEEIPEEKEVKKKKEKISERDFFSILLQPIFVSKVWNSGIICLGKFFRIFQVEFENSYIAGIHGPKPADTGMLAAIAAALPSIFPQCKGWNVHWDWCGNTPFSIQGNCILKMNLFRIGRTIFYLLYHGVFLFILYRKLRKKYLKNKEEMPLSWWRKKIVNFLAEE